MGRTCSTNGQKLAIIGTLTLVEHNNLQKFVQLYAAVSTLMKQRQLVVGRVQVEHRFSTPVQCASPWKLDTTQ